MRDKEYWKHRCKLAEKYIYESPCAPDLEPEQWEAWNKWIKFKEVSTLDGII